MEIMNYNSVMYIIQTPSTTILLYSHTVGNTTMFNRHEGDRTRKNNKDIFIFNRLRRIDRTEAELIMTMSKYSGHKLTEVRVSLDGADQLPEQGEVEDEDMILSWSHA